MHAGLPVAAYVKIALSDHFPPLKLGIQKMATFMYTIEIEIVNQTAGCNTDLMSYFVFRITLKRTKQN